MTELDDESVGRVFELAHELGSYYADDGFALEALFEGTLMFAEQQRLPMELVAEQFLDALDKWITRRNGREAEAVQEVREMVAPDPEPAP